MAKTKQTQNGEKTETAQDKKGKFLDLARQKYILQVKEYVDDYVNLNAFQLVNQNVSNNTVVNLNPNQPMTGLKWSPSTMTNRQTKLKLIPKGLCLWTWPKL